MIEQDTDTDMQGETTESEAISMGWSPREKWRGDPDKWVDSKEYTRRAREHLPIMQGLLNREKQAREAEKRENERKFKALQDDFNARLNATGEMARTAIQRVREQHLTELEVERRRIAVSAAAPEDRAAQFEHVTRAEQDALERFRREDEDRAKRVRETTTAQSDVVPGEVAEWGTRNPWFYALKQAGSPLAQEAEAIHVALNAQGVPLRENLEEVTRRMGERYPHIVGDSYAPPRTSPLDSETRSRPSSVEGQSTGRSVSRSTVSRGWKDIPAAERDMMTKAFIDNGLYGNVETDGIAKVQGRAAIAYWGQYAE
jgi:hypothetical protein